MPVLKRKMLYEALAVGHNIETSNTKNLRLLNIIVLL
jgi:hypothetical protein